MWIPRSWRRIRIYLFYKSLGWTQERLFLRESWVVFSIFLLCWKAEFAQTHLSFYATSHSLLFLATLSLSAQHPQNIQKERDQDKEQEQGTAYYCQNFNNSFSYFGISFLQMFSNVNLGYILPFWMIRVVDLFKILDLPPLLSAFNVFVFWPFTLFFFSNRCLCMHVRAIIIRFRSLWIRFWSLCDKDIAFFWVSCFNDINVLNVQMIQNLRLQ